MTGAEIVIIAGLVGTGAAAFGQFQQGKNAQAQAKSEAAWNFYNSKVSQREAEVERNATKFEGEQQRKRARAILGRTRAAVGASGVQMEGSPLLVLEHTAAELAKTEINLRISGERRALAFESRSILDVSKAGAAKQRAAGAGRAAVIGAGSTLLQGGATAAFRKAQLKGAS